MSAQLGFDHPGLPTVLSPCQCPAWNNLWGRGVSKEVSTQAPCSPSPHLQGTHVFKTADRGSLVTVILQELPPVETQDQRCKAESGELRMQAGGSRHLAPEEQGEAGPLPSPAAS